MAATVEVEAEVVVAAAAAAPLPPSSSASASLASTSRMPAAGCHTRTTPTGGCTGMRGLAVRRDTLRTAASFLLPLPALCRTVLHVEAPNYIHAMLSPSFGVRGWGSAFPWQGDSFS